MERKERSPCIFESRVATFEQTDKRMLVDKRKEVLRLYREILRTARQFEWPNEQGQPWYAR